MKSFLTLIRSLWLVALLVLFGLGLMATASGMRALAIAYDEHAQPTIVYDAPSASVIGYDAAREQVENETRNGTTGNLVILAKSAGFVAAKTGAMPRLPGATVDPLNGQPVGRFIGSQSGPPMIEPLGGRTVAAGRAGVDTHTLYPNGANYQRLNPVGHPNNPTPHAHGHAPGTGPGMRGQGPSLDTSGNIVPWNSPEAHWPFP